MNAGSPVLGLLSPAITPARKPAVPTSASVGEIREAEARAAIFEELPGVRVRSDAAKNAGRHGPQQTSAATDIGASLPINGLGGD